ncbi:hypothetical protein [Sulfurimonas sp.]
MKQIIFLLFFFLVSESLIAEENKSLFNNFSLQGHVDITSQFYMLKPNAKEGENFTAAAILESKYEKDELEINLKLKAQQDYYDLQTESKHTDRSFVRLDELYMQYEFENDQISLGKSIKFWGALEVRNITDSFNLVDLRSDPFANDKVGSWNFTYTHYTDDGEFDAIVKFYEQDREMPAYPYVYYYFPKDIAISATASLPLKYEKKLLTKSTQYDPSLYLKYSASTETEYPLDYAVIFEKGYDSQRYYTTRLSADGTTFISNENAYLVNKLSTYSTLVVGSTLFKMEALYANVIDDSQIADYLDVGLGIEHTLTQIYKEADLGLISEYYSYTTFDKNKRDDLELYEIFENDLFLGARYSFNNGNDASLVGGVILDLQYDEQVYYLEYESRIADILKLKSDFRYIEPSKNYPTAFNLMGRHARFSLSMAYYF